MNNSEFPTSMAGHESVLGRETRATDVTLTPTVTLTESESPCPTETLSPTLALTLNPSVSMNQYMASTATSTQTMTPAGTLTPSVTPTLTPSPSVTTAMALPPDDSLELINGSPSLVYAFEGQRQQLMEKDRLLLELQAKVQDLTAMNEELKRLNTLNLHRQQDLFLTKLAYQQEIKNLRQALSESENQRIAFKETLTSLYNQVESQNKELADKRTVELNNEALRSRLSGREVELRAVEEQRDRLDEDLRHTEARAADLAHRLDELLERQTELNNRLIQMRKHYEAKVTEEHNKAAFWQHKYECERSQLLENNSYNETYWGGQCIGSHGDNNILHSNNIDNSGEHSNNIDNCVSHSNNCDSNISNNGTGYFGEIGCHMSLATLNPNTISGCRNVEEENTSSNEIQIQPIASQQGKPPLSRDNARGLSQQIPKKRFEVGLSCLPHCKNCGAVFGDRHSPEGICRFHLSPPQPYKTWKGFKEDESNDPKRNQQFYWPCCDQIGIRQPPGCKQLRHHDIIFPMDDEE